MRWKVVVEEELTAHEVEREIMSRPRKEEESGAVVQPLTGAWAPDC